MDRGSSSEDDSDSEDDVPLSISLGLATSRKPTAVMSKLVASNPAASKAGTSTMVAARVVASKPFNVPVPKPSNVNLKRSALLQLASLKKPKPNNAPGVAVVAAVVANPSSIAKSASPIQVSSTGSDQSSSEDDNGDVSDDVGENTSSEDDDDSEDDEPRARVDGRTTPMVSQRTNGVVGSPVGILVSSPARIAVERLEAALAALDSSRAPLSAQGSIRDSKNVLSGDVAPVLEQMRSGGRLTDVHVSSLLCALSSIAAKFAVVAGGDGAVDFEIETFRRVSHQLHGVWDHTLPQIELLADATRKQQEAAAYASRVASQVLGCHAALADNFAKAIEGLNRGR